MPSDLLLIHLILLTAEAKAIDLALDLVDNCNSHDKFIIFSDSFSPRAGPGVERIGRTPPPPAQSVETWPIGVRLVCRELRPVSLEKRILVIERVGCGRHATHYFGLNFSWTGDHAGPGMVNRLCRAKP